MNQGGLIMYLHFPGVTIHLEGRDPAVSRRFAGAFGPWASPEPQASEDPVNVIQLDLARVRQLPRPIRGSPLYVDHGARSTNLAVYQVSPDEFQLHFHGEAVLRICLPAASTSRPPGVTGEVTDDMLLRDGRFEDIIYTGLAPILRRYGLFLVHAFAAARSGHATLFAGPSGSGKTTSGLALLLEGWHYLANDVLLLQKRPEGVCALSTPGSIHVRPNSYALLPGLSRLLPEGKTTSRTVAHLLGPPGLETGATGSATPFAFAPVSSICFPQISDEPETGVEPISRAECLARLMAESIDQWDSHMLPAHIDLLQRLCQQATPYRVILGNGVVKLRRLPNLE